MMGVFALFPRYPQKVQPGVMVCPIPDLTRFHLGSWFFPQVFPNLEKEVDYNGRLATAFRVYGAVKPRLR